LIRPFAPEDALPINWRELLGAWVRGEDVAVIGRENMRVVDDAFVYRLVWAIEAIRMNRRANGGDSEPYEGAAAACLETGLPANTMAMLVRAGLPSRVAAKTVVTTLQPVFATRTQMNNWLQSPQVIALDTNPAWPTVDTSAIWQRFRRESQAGATGKWASEEWNMAVTPSGPALPPFPARIDVDPQSGEVSVTTPDFQRLIEIRHRLKHHSPSLFEVEFSQDGSNAHIQRIGRDAAHWVDPED